MSANYNATILADSPALFWDLEGPTGSTVVTDLSGNGRHGKRYERQVVSSAGVVAGFANPLVVDDPGKADVVLGSWGTGGAGPQAHPGTGYRADTYKPYASGSAHSFEVILQKTDPYSFATIFSGSGGGPVAGPDTTHPTWEMGETMMRFYPNVGTYPVGWVDWGTPNTGYPKSTFVPGAVTHMVCQYDDAIGVAEWYVNGQSLGRQGPWGYAHVPMAYNLTDPGLFQVGWRGNYTVPNTEVFGGLMDKIAVYEYLLTPEQVWSHYAEMRPVPTPPVTVVDLAATLPTKITGGAVAPVPATAGDVDRRQTAAIVSDRVTATLL